MNYLGQITKGDKIIEKIQKRIKKIKRIKKKTKVILNLNLRTK